MNQAAQISYAPISDISFSGLHLIEASAGTGKTFTLSSLMVRILLEKYFPRQVIATTFTRAAAAELKTRIRLRVEEIYQILLQCHSLTEAEVLARAVSATDPLIVHVLKDYAARVDYASERLKLVLDQLDELFIGTLDSFSQKLLSEFRFESGKTEQLAMSEDENRYNYQLVHDVLREWINSQPQLLIDALYAKGILKSVAAFVEVTSKALNFSSAEFEQLSWVMPKLEQLEYSQAKVGKITLNQLAAYYQLDGEYYAYINGSSFRNQSFHLLFSLHLPRLFKLWQSGLSVVVLSDTLKTERTAAEKFLVKFHEQKIFKKCPAEVSQGFYQHPVVVSLVECLEAIAYIEQQLNQVQAYLNGYICEQVKQRLPKLLEQHRETTFSQQIRSLADALDSQQGQLFAAFVHARYPLILVDEFQDTNQDQDYMLARIWRHPERYQRGCMIMVGDRKQAIYGFRGGDMLTFLNAYYDIRAKGGREYRLIYNHRSVAPLVEVVDQLFRCESNFGEQVYYEPIQAGQRAHPALVDQQQSNPSPLRWISLGGEAKEAEQVGFKIRSLLNQAQTGTLYLDTPSKAPIVAEDIAILSRNHSALDEVQSLLDRLGIMVNRPSRRRVFDHPIAQDIGAVLAAILHPFDEAKIKRAMFSRLLGFDLERLFALERTGVGLSDYMSQFDQLRELWLKQGFWVAWQRFLSQFRVWEQIVRTDRRDGERALVNVRHITELLGQQHSRHAGLRSLYHWYLKKLESKISRDTEMERALTSEAGVKLMTIHQSKGLEFKIVFLLGADKAGKKDQNKLTFFSQEVADQQSGQTYFKRVISTAEPSSLSEDKLNQHQARLDAEQNRLWYVALTRASHRVYALLHDHKAQSRSGLGFWKNLAPKFEHALSQDEDLLNECPPLPSLGSVAAPPEMIAKALPERRFYSRDKTSFSYLAQHLKFNLQQQDRLISDAVSISSATDEMSSDQGVDVQALSELESIGWLQQNFPKGTIAGNFLHEIFEHLDFKDQSLWPLEIRRRFKNDYSGLWSQLYERYLESHAPEQAEEKLYQGLISWFADILATPLHDEFRLADLQTGQFLSECPFYLALADQMLGMSRVWQLFAEYGYHMPEFQQARSARYLNGSIDLIYSDGKRYYIADYKSNYLGHERADYQPEMIAQNMTHSSYWLQAGLYLVALHRYLKLKLKNYQIDEHLGGASYLYLRGMNREHQQGCLFFRPESEFILRLDALLGYSQG